MQKHFYVYVDYRLDTNEPFYVGKGDEKRIATFERNIAHFRISKKHGMKRVVVMGSLNEEYTLEEEQRLIRELKTRNHFGGANFTDGGEGTSGHSPSKETRLLISKKLSESLLKHHPLKGRARPINVRIQIQNSILKKQKPIEQLDLENHVIGSFRSQKEAARILNIDASKIGLCCRLKRQTAYGFRWRYANDQE